MNSLELIANIYDLGMVVEALPELSPFQIVVVTLFYGVHIEAALFTTKSAVTLVLRQAGLSHPGHYHRWPRVPWRLPFKIRLILKAWNERVFQVGTQATGGFAGMLATMTLLYKPGMVLLGRLYGWGVPLLQPVGMRVSRHLFMFAMTGAGKTTALITQLAVWVGSAFIIDPKGQITKALYGLLRCVWHVLDPYGITGIPSASVNVFDIIKWAMARFGEDAAVLWAQRIAEALIVTPEGSRSPFFTDTFRGYITSLILHILSAHPEDDHHLPFMRDLIVGGYRVFNADGSEETSAEEAQELLLRAMRNNPAFGGVIAGGAAAMAKASGETGGNVLATGIEQTKWLDIPQIRAVTKTSSFDLADLKTRSDVKFSFVASVLSIREELSSFSRLLANMTIYVFEAEPQKYGQCLMMVDEFPSIGYNPVFEVALAVFRSYGITFEAIAQDIQLLQKAYPKSWRSFISNADAVFWLATNDADTKQFLAKELGRKTIVEVDPNSGRKSYRDVDVMNADQVGRYLDADSARIIVTRAGKRALRLVNEPYYTALPVWGSFADPDHGEPFLRAFFRKVFGAKTLAPKSPGHAETNQPDQQEKCDDDERD